MSLLVSISSILSAYRGCMLNTVRSMSVAATSTLQPVVKRVRVEHGGANADIGYVDIGPRAGPIFLALHGAPGTFDDFQELFAPLSDAGIRTLMPQFPGYGNTQIDDGCTFDESTNARSNLIVGFLKALEIKTVAVVAGHSLGIATAFHLVANTDICCSLVYLSGIGLRPHRSIRPYWATCLYGGLLQNSWTGPLAARSLTLTYRSRGFSISTDAGLKTAVISVTKISYDQLVENIHRVRSKNTPMIFAFTQNDKLVEWQICMEAAQAAGVTDDKVTWLDAAENVVKGPDVDVSVYPRAFVFERGGHFVHRSHQRILGSSIVDLVRSTERLKTGDSQP